jgi:hypothetical protein
MNDLKIAPALRLARGAAVMFALAAFATGCDVTSVVGYDESALGSHFCAASAPLARCDGGACVIRDLEPAQVGSTAIAVDDEFVYYLREASAIVKAPVGGGSVVDLASSAMGVAHMAVDREHLYWSEFGRRIWRVRKAGGPAEVVADIDGHPGVLALDETYVYATLTDTYQLVMTPKQLGTRAFLPDQDQPSWVATDTTHVYWINQGSSPNSGELLRAPLASLTNPELLLAGLDTPVTLGLSERDVYFAAGGALVRVGKGGGEPETVFTELDEPKSIVAYSDSVYVSGISGLLRFRPGDSATLDPRTTLGLAVACSGVFATGWLVPALLRYAP